jgi:hypothetical protein
MHSIHPSEAAQRMCRLLAHNSIPERPLASPAISHSQIFLRTDEHLIAIGSGPAGLSAAYYLRKLGYRVTVFEAKEKAGGDATISGPLSVVAALASGRRAAEAINNYLTRCNGDCLGKSSRVKTPGQSLSDYRLDKEDVPGLDLNAVETEAKRCFNCGCDGVNPSDIAPALVALDATIVTSK